MAINPRSLRTDVTLTSDVQYASTHSIVALFAPDADIDTVDTDVEDIAAPLTNRGDRWPILTPLWFDTSATGEGTSGAWAVWKDATKAIEGFLIGASGTNHDQGSTGDYYSGRLQLDDTLYTQGVVLMAGSIKYSDIPLPPAEDAATGVLLTQAEMDAQLQTTVRTKNIHIEGLEGAVG